jgi:hypothetical protein
VPKASIRGRISRKSLVVETQEKKIPSAASIDDELVTQINDWLGQGISVTRDQGLAFATRLLEGKKGANKIVLDSEWWKSFLMRNKSKLICADN